MPSTSLRFTPVVARNPALGSYNGGTMLFLDLGTGLGSALMVRGHIVPMELGALACGSACGKARADDRDHGSTNHLIRRCRKAKGVNQRAGVSNPE